MPIYEYRCSKCGKEMEIMHKVSDPSPTVCPECQAQGTLERLVSRSAFHLKGGGWYSDLYGSSKGTAGTKDTSSTSTSSPTTPATTSSTGSGSGSSGSSST